MIRRLNKQPRESSVCSIFAGLREGSRRLSICKVNCSLKILARAFSAERRFNISRPSIAEVAKSSYRTHVDRDGFARNFFLQGARLPLASSTRSFVRKIATFDRECNSGCTCSNEAPRHAEFQMMIVVVVVVVTMVSMKLEEEFDPPQECPVYSSRLSLSLSLSQQRTSGQFTPIYKESLHRFL